MALMTLAQAREIFFAAMETLRSSKDALGADRARHRDRVSSVISMAAIIQGLNKFVQDRVGLSRLAHLLRSRFSAGHGIPPAGRSVFRTRSISNTTTPATSATAAPDVQP